VLTGFPLPGLVAQLLAADPTEIGVRRAALASASSGMLERCSTLRRPAQMLVVGGQLREVASNTESAQPRSLGAEYLQQALEAIRASGSSEALYDHSYRSASPEARTEIWRAIAGRDAARRRVRSSRAATLFAAFAAEAYINEFISAHIRGRDYEAVDRLQPIAKYTVVPRLALGRALFRRDAEPLPTIADLFRRRDVLVHPKPGRGLVEPSPWQADSIYNPLQATVYVISVAAAARVLVAHTKTGDRIDLYAELIVRGSKFVGDYAATASQSLADVDRPPAPDLLVEMLGRDMAELDRDGDADGE
jgi:hypothetical protein